MKLKLLVSLLIILCIVLFSALVINIEKQEKESVENLNISVVISTSDFNEIFHENVVISSGRKFKIKKDDGIEVVPSNHSYIFNIENMEVGQCFNINSTGDSLLKIESITRAYGVPEYYGDIKIYRKEEGFVIVNILPLETYLRYVVPSEMPSDYGLEALKAQVICARNFAIQHILNPAYPEYDAALDDSIRFQVYNNQISNDITDKAIVETENLVLKYNDELISTYYYSTSWGHTTDLSLWSGEESPYYKSLSMSEDHQYMDLSNEANFKEFLTDYDKAYEANEPWYRWTYFISLKDIKKNIDTYLDIDIENIDTIEIISRRAGGSVSKLKIVDDKNTYEITKESEVRNIFIPFNSEITRNDGSVLEGYSKCPSSYYMIEPVFEEDLLTGYVLSGGGCGHGLGMSQNCSKILAAKGMGFDEILEYFYIGCKVTEYQ